MRESSPTLDVSVLLPWAEENLRPLPWRSVRDGWSILVSEVMSQQTQVSRVIPKWHAFLGQWPTPLACAQAELSEVLVLWQGLGYPRRARALHECAKILAERYDGRLPQELDQLLRFPGIGPYTARAIAAFAFEAEVGVVDTNVGRVLARLVNRRLSASEAQALADELVPASHSWLHNQAMIEVGATLCRSVPSCSPCPFVGICEFHLAAVATADRCGAGSAEDPAVGSAMVSGRQSAFADSDRQFRGKILAALAQRPFVHDELRARIGLDADPDRFGRLVSDLILERLVSESGSPRTVVLGS